VTKQMLITKVVIRETLTTIEIELL